MARLKVFRWSDGFHAWTVAAPSRAKALAAWGFTRDLFKDGSAQEIKEGEDFDRALAAPGDLIERGLAVDVGEVTKAAAPKHEERRNEAAQKRVVKLERDLAELDEAQAAEAEALERKRAAVETEMQKLSASHRKGRKALLAKVKAARARV